MPLLQVPVVVGGATVGSVSAFVEPSWSPDFPLALMVDGSLVGYTFDQMYRLFWRSYNQLRDEYNYLVRTEVDPMASGGSFRGPGVKPRTLARQLGLTVFAVAASPFQQALDLLGVVGSSTGREEGKVLLGA